MDKPTDEQLRTWSDPLKNGPPTVAMATELLEARKRMEWLEAQMKKINGRWPTYDPVAMDVNDDAVWAWCYGDSGPYDSLNSAIDAAMKGKP